LSIFFPSVPPDKEEKLFEKTAGYFAVLADPSRLLILHCLCQSKGELSVGQIVSMTKLSQPNVSRHLNRLAILGFASRRRFRNQVYYKLVDPTIEELCSLVCNHVS